MTLRTKAWIHSLLVALASGGGYRYYSPYSAIKPVQSAAQHKDAEASNEHVDYPR